MSSSLRIAVLLCDTPVPKVNERYDGYGGMFKGFLKSSAEALNQKDRLDPETGFELTNFDVVNENRYPKLDDIDAVILTGSKHNSYGDDQWILDLIKFTKQVLAQDRVRLLGICFGHQIVGRILGSKVGPSDEGWETSVCDMNLTETGKELFGRDKLRIQQMHQDIVHSLPAGVESLGSSSLCQIQGMYMPGRFITVQGHPEYNADVVTDIVEVRHTTHKVFTKEFVEESLGRANFEHDGVDIGAVFLKFLLGE